MPKITKLIYNRRFNLGEYNHEDITLEACNGDLEGEMDVSQGAAVLTELAKQAHCGSQVYRKQLQLKSNDQQGKK